VLSEQEKVAQRQAALTERQLDSQVRKPADAERYKVEQEAEARRTSAVADADARRQATIAAAQAQAKEARVTGEGEKLRRAALAEAEAIEGLRRGEAERARRAAIAEAVRLEGEAQASATREMGLAEAEAMDKRAAAFAAYNEAAVLQMLIEALPNVAREVSAPLGSIDQLTVISTEGASALPRQVAGNLAQTLQVIRDMTGVDLADLVKRHGGTGTSGGATVVPARADSDGVSR
jgi:flotillin